MGNPFNRNESEIVHVNTGFIILISALVAASLTDIAHRRIPNAHYIPAGRIRASVPFSCGRHERLDIQFFGDPGRCGASAPVPPSRRHGSGRREADGRRGRNPRPGGRLHRFSLQCADRRPLRGGRPVATWRPSGYVGQDRVGRGQPDPDEDDCRAGHKSFTRQTCPVFATAWPFPSERSCPF